MRFRALWIPIVCSALVALLALLARDHYASAFRRTALEPVPVHGGPVRSIVYADFDGNGFDERFQLFRSGLAGTLVSPEGARTRWQFNGDREYQDAGAIDIAGDSAPELWLRGSTKDELYAVFLDAITGEAVDSITLTTRDFPPGDSFHPKNGVFDGAAIPIDRVTLPDGHGGVVLEFRCGHHLMPRGYAAWDLTHRRLAWRVPLGPTPTTDRYVRVRTPAHPEGLYISGTVAPCNGSDSLGIPDREYGIVAVSTAGRVAWWRRLGEGFGDSYCDFAMDSAATTPHVVAVANSAGVDGTAPCLLSLRADDGALVDSVSLGAIAARVITCDVDADGRDDAVISYEDGRLEARRVERGFPIVRAARMARGVQARLALRLPGDRSSVFVCADSARIYLLDTRFRTVLDSPWPSGSTQNVLLRLVRLPGGHMGLGQTGGEGFLFRISSQQMATAPGLALLAITISAMGLPWIALRRADSGPRLHAESSERAPRSDGHPLHDPTRELFCFLQERSHSSSLRRSENASNALLSIAQKSELTEEQLGGDEVWSELLGLVELVRTEILERVLPGVEARARAAHVPRGLLVETVRAAAALRTHIREVTSVRHPAGQRLAQVRNLGQDSRDVSELLRALGEFTAHALAEPVGPLLDDVLRDFWHVCGVSGKEVLLVVSYEVPREVRVVMGAELFGSVVRNLLNNAIVAVEGRPTRRIDVKIVSTGTVRPKLDLVVLDTGPGVPAELRGVIFTGFSTRGGGTGLRHAREATGRYRGDVLEPEDGEAGGALFRVRLCRGEYFAGGF